MVQINFNSKEPIGRNPSDRARTLQLPVADHHDRKLNEIIIVPLYSHRLYFLRKLVSDEPDDTLVFVQEIWGLLSVYYC